MKNKRILLLVPAYSARGGISNYYHSLKGRFSLPVDYVERGARNLPYRGSKFKEAIRIVEDLLEYIFLLLNGEYALIQTSTSLGSGSVRRDGLYLWIAQVLNIKTIVFYRGWDYRYKKQLDLNLNRFFKNTFLRADASIVLSSQFKEDLLSWGYNKKIYIETTIVDENIIPNIDTIIEAKLSTKVLNPVFLFLSRIEKEKGIYEAIEAFRILKIKYNNSRLIIAGDGSELDRIKAIVNNEKINSVDFKGFVRNKDKTDVLMESNVFLLPSYSEGMPNSVLEAMAFGLPILATPVGGLIDILNDGISGYFIKKNDINSITEAADKLITSPEIWNKIIQHNIKQSIKFYTSEVVKRLEKIYLEVQHS